MPDPAVQEGDSRELVVYCVVAVPTWSALCPLITEHFVRVFCSELKHNCVPTTSAALHICDCYLNIQNRAQISRPLSFAHTEDAHSVTVEPEMRLVQKS